MCFGGLPAPRTQQPGPSFLPRLQDPLLSSGITETVFSPLPAPGLMSHFNREEIYGEQNCIVFSFSIDTTMNEKLYFIMFA